MTDLSNNPFLKNNKVVVGKEREFLKWNSKALAKNNPFVDNDGFPLDDKFEEHSAHMAAVEKQYLKDLKLLPLDIQKEFLKDSERFQEKMQSQVAAN